MYMFLCKAAQTVSELIKFCAVTHVNSFYTECPIIAVTNCNLAMTEARLK